MPELTQEKIDEQIDMLREIHWCKKIRKNLDENHCYRIRFEMKSEDFAVDTPEIREEIVEQFKVYLAKRESKLTRQYEESMK